MKNRYLLALIAALAGLSLLSGCAKFPNTPGISGKQLVITLKVAGKIEPTDPTDPSVRRYYFIAIDNDTGAGCLDWNATGINFAGAGITTTAAVVAPPPR